MSCWIIPCNTKNFNIIEHFVTNSEVVFKKDGLIKNGDYVYIYLAAPFKRIKYKCVVISTKVSDEELKQHQYAVSPYSMRQSYMKLKYEYTFETDQLTFDKLKKNGLGQVQRQSRLDGKLLEFINSFK